MNTFVISSCRIMHRVTQRLLPGVTSSGLRSPQISTQSCILGLRWTGCSKFQCAAKKIWWRYWFIADKHPPSHFSWECAKVFFGQFGRRSSYKHQPGINNKVLFNALFFLYFLKAFFFFLNVYQWHPWHLTISQVTVYMYAIHCKCNKVNNTIHNIQNRWAVSS